MWIGDLIALILPGAQYAQVQHRYAAKE